MAGIVGPFFHTLSKWLIVSIFVVLFMHSLIFMVVFMYSHIFVVVFMYPHIFVVVIM